MPTIKKPIRWPLIAVITLVFASATYIFVRAQTVTDTYANYTKVAASWNVSTSTTGEIKLKPKTCDTFGWYCSASTTCANSAGDGTYIVVAQSDVPASKQWKTANTPCDRPQCGANGGQDGDNLEESNILNFTAYPARDYCKSIGGRLPTRSELFCMWTNRATFGNNFGAAYYWSSTENSDTNAWNRSFSTGAESNYNKTASYLVRCVQGW